VLNGHKNQICFKMQLSFSLTSSKPSSKIIACHVLTAQMFEYQLRRKHEAVGQCIPVNQVDFQLQQSFETIKVGIYQLEDHKLQLIAKYLKKVVLPPPGLPSTISFEWFATAVSPGTRFSVILLSPQRSRFSRVKPCSRSAISAAYAQ